MNPKVWPFKLKLLSSSFLWHCSLLYKVVLTFESVDEILKCDHSNESYRAVLTSRGTVCSTGWFQLLGLSWAVDETPPCDQKCDQLCFNYVMATVPQFCIIIVFNVTVRPQFYCLGLIISIVNYFGSLPIWTKPIVSIVVMQLVVPRWLAVRCRHSLRTKINSVRIHFRDKNLVQGKQSEGQRKRQIKFARTSR